MGVPRGSVTSFDYNIYIYIYIYIYINHIAYIDIDYLLL